jgi:prefoldin subunit 5
MSENIQRINQLFVSKAGNKGTDMSGVIVLFIVCALILIVYFKMTQRGLWLDWDNQKCHPSILFFNGLINPNINETAFQSIQTNFMDCLRPYTNVLKSEKYKTFDKSIDGLISVNRNMEESYEVYAKKVEKMRMDLEKQHAVLDVSFQAIQTVAETEQETFERTFRYITTNIKRLFVVLDRITTYMKDLLIYKVSVNVDERFMNTQVNDSLGSRLLGIDEFQEYMNQQYEANYTNKYVAAFDTMKAARLRPGFDANTTDFSQSIHLADQAIAEYDRMIQLIERFESQNQELFEKTNQYCAELKNHNYSCVILLPSWKD